MRLRRHELARIFHELRPTFASFRADTGTRRGGGRCRAWPLPAETNGSIKNGEVMEFCGLSGMMAKILLGRLVQEGCRVQEGQDHWTIYKLIDGCYLNPMVRLWFEP